MPAAKLDSKGQVVIPLEIRQRQGWREGIELEFAEVQGGVEIRPVASNGAARKYQEMTAQERLAAFEQWLVKFGGSLKGRTTTQEAMRLTRGDE